MGRSCTSIDDEGDDRAVGDEGEDGDGRSSASTGVTIAVVADGAWWPCWLRLPQLPAMLINLILRLLVGVEGAAGADAS